MSIYNYRRRPTTEVRVGNIIIGGANPVRLQSMTNTDTNDTAACVRQAREIAAAGGELVRLTTQGQREALNMAEIKRALTEAGCDVPIVADVHFNPKVAYTAAETSDKVRINPGNFVDAARTFRHLEYTDEEYAAEMERIRAALRPLLEVCRRRGVPLRLGVNHGSLSDRIMSRYGDTPAGMTESVMEFLRICRDEDFDAIVISIKASNPVVMVQTVRMLVKHMEREGFAFPIHLGVTEAGAGEDGRVKSAVGIGTLLAEGIGDTIRVSLSEDPAAEIPVARMLRDYIAARADAPAVTEPAERPERNASGDLLLVGVDKPLREIDHVTLDTEDPIPDAVAPHLHIRITTRHPNPVGAIMAYADRLWERGIRNPQILSLSYLSGDADEVRIKAAADFGALLLNGYGEGLELSAPYIPKAERNALLLGIMQAARRRITRTEFIACPGCGRTLFDLPETLRRVREGVESHPELRHLKIAVMGCIVNGPGEMADADYGYVGAAAGKISLYRGKECLRKNIPQEEAVTQLLALIRADSPT